MTDRDTQTETGQTEIHRKILDRQRYTERYRTDRDTQKKSEKTEIHRKIQDRQRYTEKDMTDRNTQKNQFNNLTS